MGRPDGERGFFQDPTGHSLGSGVEQGDLLSPAGSSEKGLSSRPQGRGKDGNSFSLLRLRNSMNKDLEDMAGGGRHPRSSEGLEKGMVGYELREGERV